MHDDRLVSAALVSVYDELVLEGLLRTGRGKAAVIRGRDPLEEMGFELLHFQRAGGIAISPTTPQS